MNSHKKVGQNKWSRSIVKFCHFFRPSHARPDVAVSNMIKDYEHTLPEKNHTFSTKGVISSLTTLSNDKIVSFNVSETSTRLWNQDGTFQRFNISQKSPLESCAVLSNDDVVFGLEDGKIRIWDSKTKSIRLTFAAPAWVRSIAVLPNDYIATVSWDNVIRIWEPKHGWQKATFNEHANPGHDPNKAIFCLAISPHQSIVSGSTGKIQVWDNQTGACKLSIPTSPASVTQLAILSNGDIVSVYYQDKQIMVWDGVNGACKATLSGHTDCINAVMVLPNDDIVSASADQTIRIWDSQTFSCKSVLRGHMGDIRALTYLHNGQIVSASEDQTLRIWDFAIKPSPARVAQPV